MIIREATIEDVESVRKQSVSRAPKDYGNGIDVVYAIEVDGQPIAVGGLRLLTPTTAWAWMDWTPEAKNHVYSVYRHVSRVMDELAKANGLRRIMAVVPDDFEEGMRTAEHLGFVQEAVLPEFFGTQAAIQYGRLSGGT